MPTHSPAALARATALIVLVGVGCGALAAVFLWLLHAVTALRVDQGWLVLGLPLGGAVLGALLVRYGGRALGGVALVRATFSDDAALPVPVRMGPLVLTGTLVTHLFGGSAGREGTAVQMGASFADAVALRARATPFVRRACLVAGVAGGFGAVFGTPLAGAVFALELFRMLRRKSATACDLAVFSGAALVGSFVGHVTAGALGATHMLFPRLAWGPLTPRAVLGWALMAVAVGAVARVFLWCVCRIKSQAVLWLPALPARMAVGGALVVGLWLLAGTDAYLGLSLPLLRSAFESPLSWSVAAWKLAFTVITLGAGFVGGEVTPLFCIGASLGSAAAPWMGVPVALAAGVGMAALFGAAARAPIALSIMAVELLGFPVGPYVVVVALTATWIAGRRGLYDGEGARNRGIVDDDAKAPATAE